MWLDAGSRGVVQDTQHVTSFGIHITCQFDRKRVVPALTIAIISGYFKLNNGK